MSSGELVEDAGRELVAIVRLLVLVTWFVPVAWCLAASGMLEARY